VDSEFSPPELDDAPKPERRPGKARERQRRRQQRQQQQEQATPRPSRQLAPSGRVKLNVNLPSIRLTRFRLVAGVIFGVVVVASVIFLLRQIKPATPDDLPHAVWIGTEWTYESHEAEAITQLVDQWRENDIGAVYAWVSWLQEDGTWRGAENFTNVRAFAQQVKEAYPQVDLLGWLSFPVNLGEDGYRLDDEELQQNIADFSASIVSELGFDGVFLNVEPVWTGDESYLELLRKVRASIGDDVTLSVAAPPDWSPENAGIPVPPLIVPGTIWETEYKQSVALLADQIAVMAYNSGLSSPTDYEQWLAYQVATFARAVSALGQGTELLIGIPTYDAEPPGHDPMVENVESALDGYVSGLQQAGDSSSFVRGVAIYAGWTTDDLEWAQFGAWLNAS
jgi:hypothetical protein